jgi:hypothetical protein
MSGTEEQLVSFFLYSLFIYPVTNYLVSPTRAYPRWKGACYAILFLALISAAHMVLVSFSNLQRVSMSTFLIMLFSVSTSFVSYDLDV